MTGQTNAKNEELAQNKKIHDLHFRIGEHLKHIEKEYENVENVIDPACGGEQNIPLFLAEEKSNDNEICNVDFMMLKNHKIKIIIEIEEANIKPTQILGKFMTSALAKFYIHKTKSNEKIPMADAVCFIQILDTIKLKKNTKKIQQWKKIENAIKEVLPTLKTNIKNYKLFYGNMSDMNLDEISQYVKNQLDS
jgi:hypothetical protein